MGMTTDSMAFRLQCTVLQQSLRGSRLRRNICSIHGLGFGEIRRALDDGDSFPSRFFRASCGERILRRKGPIWRAPKPAHRDTISLVPYGRRIPGLAAFSGDELSNTTDLPRKASKTARTFSNGTRASAFT